MRLFARSMRTMLGIGVLAVGTIITNSPASAAVDSCRATVVASGVTRADLQHAIRLAPPGTTVSVVGTCVGTFVIRKDLSLKGRVTTAFPKPTLDAEGRGRVLRLLGDETDVTVIRLRITGGEAALGAGVRSGSGQLTLRHSMVRANVASESGGGVYSRGVVRIRQSALNGNRARSGGGLFNDGGRVRLSKGSVVANNTALGINGNVPAGGGLFNDGGVLRIKGDTSVSENTGLGDGGGLYNSAEGRVSMTGSATIADNYAHYGGGGIANLGAVTTDRAGTVRDNVARKLGGGILNRGRLTMSGASAIAGNVAYNRPEPGDTEGGGLFNAYLGEVVLNDTSTIKHNTADHGGGISSEVSRVTLNDSSAIARNTANGSGGGIFSYEGQMTMNDSSSVRGNTARTSVGGGIYDYLGTVVMTGTSSIHDNRAQRGGGICSDESTLTGVLVGVNVHDNVPDDVYLLPT